MKITADAILLDDQIYPTKNISSARMIEREPDYFEEKEIYLKRLAKTIPALTFIFILGICFVFVDIFRSSLMQILEFVGVSDNFSFYLAILIGAILIFLIPRNWKRMVKRRLIPRREYGIELLSNSGGLTLFWSVDKDFMGKVRDLVFDALTTSSRSLSYNVNIETKNIEDNSTNIYDSDVHIYDFSITYNQYEGLTEDQVSFMTKQFNEALSELRHLSETKNANEAINEKIEELADALRNDQPDKSNIKNAWEQLKGACDVWSTGETVTRLIATIGTGIASLVGVL